MSKPVFSTLPTGDFVLASASATRVKLLERCWARIFPIPGFNR